MQAGFTNLPIRLIAFIISVFVIVVTPYWTPAAQARSRSDFRLGLKAARAGQLDAAVKLWSKTIKRNPRLYAAYVNRGTAYMQLGAVVDGIKDWHKALKIAPVFAYGLCPGDFIPNDTRRGPLVGYVKSTELDPDYIPSVMMIGIAYSELGYAKIAADLYRRSVDLTKNPMMKNLFDHWKSELEKRLDK
jgi:tetratricopeptide (TPR) repeat protein